MEQVVDSKALEKLKGGDVLVQMIGMLKGVQNFYMETLHDIVQVFEDIKPDLILQGGIGLHCADAADILDIPLISHAPVVASITKADTPSWVVPTFDQPTTEHATTLHMAYPQRLWMTIMSYARIVKILPTLASHFWFRWKNGLKGMGMQARTSIATLYNTYFPLQMPLALEPHEHLIGPIVDLNSSPPSDAVQKFLNTHNRIGYLALGQLCNVALDVVNQIKRSIQQAMDENLLDGFIWVNKVQDFSTVEFDDRFLVVKWTSQATVMGHPNVKVFISHCGGDSVAETMVSNVKVMGIPFFGDQPINCKMLKAQQLGDYLPYARWDHPTFHERFIKLLSNDTITNQVAKSTRLAKHMSEIAPLKAASVIDAILTFGTNVYVDDGKNMGLLQRSGWDVTFGILILVVALIVGDFLVIRRILNSWKASKQSDSSSKKTKQS